MMMINGYNGVIRGIDADDSFAYLPDKAAVIQRTVVGNHQVEDQIGAADAPHNAKIVDADER
jgi:hypothetical protein